MGKKTCIKNITIKDENANELAQIIITKGIKTNPLLDLILKTDLDKILGKNLLMENKLISLAYYKVVKSVTETSSKIQELQTYDKTINNTVYGNRQ